MCESALTLIEKRISATLFDASAQIDDAEIRSLVAFATRAPTAYNLQNWRFVAARSPEAKATLRKVAFNQPKVEEAGVTFIIVGVLPDAAVVADRLSGSVEAGHMTVDIVQRWQESVRMKYADPQTARDEAVRSATFGAATLIFAAEAKGLASGAMVGFDSEGVSRAFDLHSSEIPVMLLAVGRAAGGNWPQKPRRPVEHVLELR